MVRYIVVFLASCLVSTAYADDRVRVAAESGSGFTIANPNANIVDGLLIVSGAVCRRAFSAGVPRYVRVDRYTADGDFLSSHEGMIRGMPGYRGGCGFYVVSVPALGADETARVSAVRWRGARR